MSSKYPDFLRGPLSKEAEKALIYYLDSKEKGLQHPHTQEHEQQQISTTKKEDVKIKPNTKYQRLIELIKKYSDSHRQISSGLAKKAIMQTIGKDERTIDKYLKILQEDDIIYGDSLGGKYDVQSWVFGDSIKLSKKEELQKQTTIVTTINNNNSWSKV